MILNDIAMCDVTRELIIRVCFVSIPELLVVTLRVLVSILCVYTN